MARGGAKCFIPAVTLTFFLATAPSAEESPSIATRKAWRAREIVDELRAALAIDNEIDINVVANHPLVFSVEPIIQGDRRRYLLSLELGFLEILDDSELRAALAHELGHVWIFTHHPFLQTERLANEIGQRVTTRDSLERVYSKLWAYEGAPGVKFEDLLGPPRDLEQ